MNLHRRLERLESNVPLASNGATILTEWYDPLRTLVNQILETMPADHRSLVRGELAMMLRSRLPYLAMTGPPERVYVAGKTICLLTWAVIDQARAYSDGSYHGLLTFPAALSSYYVDVLRRQQAERWHAWPPMLDPWDFCPHAPCGFRWMPAGFRAAATTCPACGEPLPPRMTSWDWSVFAQDAAVQAQVCERAIERLGEDGALAWLAANGWEPAA